MLKPKEYVPHPTPDLVGLLQLVDSAKIRPAQLRLNDAQSCTATTHGRLSLAQATHGLLAQAAHGLLSLAHDPISGTTSLPERPTLFVYLV